MGALRTRQAAAFLGIGKTKLYDLVRTGEIAYCDLGGQYSFLEADLLDYLHRNRTAHKTVPEIEVKREPLTPDGDTVSIFTGRPLREAM